MTPAVTAFLHKDQLNFLGGVLALQHLAKQLGALYAADIRGCNGQLALREVLSEMRGHHRQRRQVIPPGCGTSCPGRRVMDVECDDSVRPRGFELLCHVAGVYGITRLGAAIFSCVGEIGDYGNHTTRARVTQAWIRNNNRIRRCAMGALRVSARDCTTNTVRSRTGCSGRNLNSPPFVFALFQAGQRNTRSLTRGEPQGVTFAGREYQGLVMARRIIGVSVGTARVAGHWNR